MFFTFGILCLSVAAQGARKKDVSILSECLWNQALYQGDQVDCNDLYHHYLPKKDREPSKTLKGRVRIGSLNAYRFGLRDTHLKDISFLSKMVNSRWDVVALSELHHNMSMPLRMNVRAMRGFLKGLSRKRTRKAYRRPGYLKLLMDLQARDSSWGLILSPTGQGTTNELFGFLYRKSVVHPVSSKYCKARLDKARTKSHIIYGEIHEEFTRGFKRYKEPAKREFESPWRNRALACHLDLKGLTKNVYSRIPFMGRFQSGKSDFSLVSLHSRFRPPGTVRGKCAEECKSIIAKMVKVIGTKGGVQDLPDSEIARFFEADVLIKESHRISKMENDADTLIAGDFNLEYGPESARGRTKAWDALLSKKSGRKIFIEQRTSLSKPKGLSQNYDHFVFSPDQGDFQKCDLRKIKAVDFTKQTSIFTKFFSGFHNRSQHQVILNKYLKKLEGQYSVVKGISYPLWEVERSELKDFFNGFPADEREKREKDYKRVSHRRFRSCETGESQVGTLSEAIENDLFCRILWQARTSRKPLRKARQPFRVYTELVSDHLPIEMVCDT